PAAARARRRHTAKQRRKNLDAGDSQAHRNDLGQLRDVSTLKVYLRLTRGQLAALSRELYAASRIPPNASPTLSSCQNRSFVPLARFNSLPSFWHLVIRGHMRSP